MTDLVVTPLKNIQASDVQGYISKALSENSRKAYRSDMEHYLASGGQIPATPEQIATYLSFFAPSLSIATLQRRLVSISKAHALQGYPDPVKNEYVRMTMRGIRRVHGKPQSQVSPLLKEDLTIMLSHCPDTLKGKRDQAILLLGFCGAFRRSELSALRCTDLEFVSQGTGYDYFTYLAGYLFVNKPAAGCEVCENPFNKNWNESCT